VFTSTVYITTFWVMVALSRTLPTVPWNSLPGNASQVEGDGRVRADAANVRLVDRHPNLHFRQVLRDEEKTGALRLATTV